MRFAAHADGVSSALVQCRTRRQLRGVLAAKAYVPLDAETRASVVALQTDPHTGAHGAERLAVWTWGAPAPRACARWAINRRLHPTTGNALAASHAEGSSAGRVARALADDGFAVLPGAFDDDALREALVAAVACHDRQGYFRSRETGTPAAADAGKALRAAVSAAVDANVETSIGGGSALAALSLPGSKGFEAWVTTHAPNGGTQPAGGWRAPSPRDPRETTPPGFAATWHVDWGNGSRGRAGISRPRTTRAPPRNDPRPRRGVVAAIRLHGTSTSPPRRRRDPPSRKHPRRAAPNVGGRPHVRGLGLRRVAARRGYRAAHRRDGGRGGADAAAPRVFPRASKSSGPSEYPRGGAATRPRNIHTASRCSRDATVTTGRTALWHERSPPRAREGSTWSRCRLSAPRAAPHRAAPTWSPPSAERATSTCATRY